MNKVEREEEKEREKMNAKLLMALIAALLVVALVPSSLMAASASDTMSVSASVTASCTINVASLSFGGYDPIGANETTPNDKEANVQVKCTKGTVANVEMDNGSNFSGTRRMADGSGNYLNYEVYQDSGRSTRWGSVADGQQKNLGAAPSSTTQTFQAYGRIPAGQDVSTGVYNDTVTATVNF